MQHPISGVVVVLGGQGSGKLVAERAAYFALVEQGVGFREAARRVGVDYRLTKRWRAAPSVAVPVVEREVSPRFLSLDERVLIADLRRESVSVREIGRRLERPASTISRELTRNQQPNGCYRPNAAHQLAVRRRARPKLGKIAADPALRANVQDGLDQRWSPQQIACMLRRDHPERPEWHVTHETIYQALHVQAKGSLRREVASWLRTGRVHRRPHRKPGERQPRMATPMVRISQRPAEATDRAVPEHWEGDLIIGKNHGSAIGTLVERATRFVMLLHLPDGYAPATARDALIAKTQTLPPVLKGSLTWDQGSEMHYHGQFTIATNMPIYFCDPHSPWQRGTNETPTDCYASISPKEPIYQCTRPSTWTSSLINSTADPG